MTNEGLSMIKKIQRMNPAQAYLWLMRFYKNAYEEGLRDGEREFDDAIILTEDEARERFSNEAVDELLSDS